MDVTYKSNILKLILVSCCQSFILAYVIERIFGLERGLSILEIQYIIIIYSVACLILEVPFGVLADKWKKKYVLAIGTLFCCFEFLISIYAYNFTVFSIAFLLAAVGGSLKSGTIESLLFQSLKELNRESEYEKYKGLIKFYKYATSGIAGILGGYVAYYYGLEASYWLSLVTLPLGAVISLFLYEPTSSSQAKTSEGIATYRSFINHIRQSIFVLRENPRLFSVMLYGGIMGAILYGQLHEMSSIIYLDIGISLSSFGYISFLITIFGGLAGIIAYRVKNTLGYPATFTLILCTTIWLIYSYSQATEWWHVIYIILAIGVMEMVSPLTSGYIHHRIMDKYRVTISSLEAFLLNGLTILISLLFGLIADIWSIYAAFKAMSLLLFVYGAIMLCHELKRPISSFRIRSRLHR